MTIDETDIVRLKTPDVVKATGRPEAFVIRANGQLYELPWGTDFRVSHHCDPDNKIASLDYKGSYPLIRAGFVRQHEHQFELISKGE